MFNRNTIADTVWDDLEQLLFSADVGVNATQQLIERVKVKVRNQQLGKGEDVYGVVKEEITGMLADCNQELVINHDGLHVMLVVGVNGVGKTTTIAKLAHRYIMQGNKVVLAAGDTFRAAAIDQLKIWGQRIGCDVIAHQPGGDPGAVVFDAMSAAVSRNAEVLIVDTAGRLHTKSNLMEELKKINRIIAKFDTAILKVLLVLDATTGQNGLTQAKYFFDAVGVNGIILTKLDGTAKGGIILAICNELKIPIFYLGIGQELDDFVPFAPKEFVEALLT